MMLLEELTKFSKEVNSNIYGKKIVIGMGAGTISAWMRELQELI